ncbi:unnamed protein product [Arabidopsis lyrata]|nr:unnamed protein product [Arabidopsis lyrata]
MSLRLERHKHYVDLVKQRDGFECDVCDRSYGDGLCCSECNFTIHRKCAFVFMLRDLYEHPSHVGHRLKLLTTGAPNHTDPKCHLCGKNTKRLLYHCSVCKLNLDFSCIFDYFSSQAHLIYSWHHHPLLFFGFRVQLQCDVCHMSHRNGYFCSRCQLVVHKECVSKIESAEITHPFHARHPLKLLTDGAPDYTDPECHICGKETANLLYHCDKCKFNLDIDCAIGNPQRLSLSKLKVHEHTLTLMPKLMFFVCDACGKKGDHAPYTCVQCDFMFFHQKCAYLPLVINVNHHEHRVSFKYPLGPGEWICGVCWEEINWSYGAYSCSSCPNYAIHSRCATRKDVWDGKELDGVPEVIEDVKPFKMNDDNTITHFTHEHNMSLNKVTQERSICEACVLPIDSYTSYKCSKSDCCFILHETCANLPKKRRHFLSPQPLTLRPQSQHKKETICRACDQVFCQGFVYSTYQKQNFDLLCSSITVPFKHGSHHHHLLYVKLEVGHMKTCQNCGIDQKEVVLGCIKCNYFLDFRCATLPYTVRLPRYDDHPLTLCYGENASGKYWCDICERETNSKTWFYTCKDCGVTLHVFCVVGDIRYAKPGGSINNNLELVPNNRSSRPLCRNCHCHCPAPFILKDSVEDNFCSYYCFSRCKPWMSLMKKEKGICPPWTKN